LPSRWQLEENAHADLCEVVPLARLQGVSDFRELEK
jgi:hypothetical protein